MNFSNYSRQYLVNSNFKNTLLLVLAKRNNNFYKTINSLSGFYKDKILKDNIYIATTGITQDSFIRKSKNINNILFFNKKDFISYFKISQFKSFNFINYPLKYKKIIINNYFFKKFLFHKYKQSKYTNVDYNYDYNDILVVKRKKNKIIGVSDSGKIKKFRKYFFSKLCYAGLVRIIIDEMKVVFEQILILFYLLLNYFGNLLVQSKRNNLMIYEFSLYSNLYDFFFKKFSNFWYKNKIKLRKKNNFFYKYFNIIWQQYTIYKYYNNFFISKFYFLGSKNLENNSMNILTISLYTLMFYNSKEFLFSKLLKTYTINNKLVILKTLLYILYLTYHNKFNRNNIKYYVVYNDFAYYNIANAVNIFINSQANVPYVLGEKGLFNINFFYWKWYNLFIIHYSTKYKLAKESFKLHYYKGNKYNSRKLKKWRNFIFLNKVDVLKNVIKWKQEIYKKNSFQLLLKNLHIFLKFYLKKRKTKSRKRIKTYYIKRKLNN